MMMNCAWNGDSDWGNESGSLFQNGLCTLRYILISTWYISMDRAVSDFKAGGCRRLSKSDNRWGTTDTRKSAAGFILNVTGMAFDRRYRYFATEDTAVQHNASSFRISRGMPSTSVSTPRNPRGFCHSRAALYSSDVVLETRVLVSSTKMKVLVLDHGLGQVGLEHLVLVSVLEKVLQFFKTFVVMMAVRHTNAFCERQQNQFAIRKHCLREPSFCAPCTSASVEKVFNNGANC